MGARKTDSRLTLAQADALQHVPDEIPTPCRILFVGEAPAREEIRHNRPFVGPSGEILWQWVWKYMKLERHEVGVANLFPFQLPDKKGKGVEELLHPEVIEHHTAVLRYLVSIDSPEFIVTLGRYSTRALLGDVDMEWSHGIGFRTEYGVVIPVFHPAAGLHSPDRLQFTALDLKAANQIVRGEVEPREYTVRARKTTALSALPRRARWCAIDTEGENYSIQASTEFGSALLIRKRDEKEVMRFRRWLEDCRPTVIFHNALHDLRVLREGFGIDIIAMGLRILDTMSMAHILQDQPRGLKPLAQRLLGIGMEDYDDVVWPRLEEQIKEWLIGAACLNWPHPGKRKKPIPYRIMTLLDKTGAEFRTAWSGWEIKDKVVGKAGPPPEPDYDTVPGFDQYAMRDSSVTLGCAGVLAAKIEDAGLQRVLDLDMAVIPFLDRVMRNGLHCDIDKLVEFHADVQTRKSQSVEVIRALVGDEKFNPASADQVEAQLKPYLDKLAAEGRVRLTKNKKRYQVDSGVLEQIKDEDPLIPAVLEFRELDKLDGTYLSPLYGFLQYDPDTELFRLPLNLRHAFVVSGRLSAFDPNVLAWPSRSKDGLKLRSCFRAPKGRMLASWDLSQIEMRLAAGFSHDTKMLLAFEDGVDLHTRTAAVLFGVEESKVDKFTQRTPTKTISYLILYGGSEEKMFTELKVMGVPGFDRERCAKLIFAWKQLYSGVWDFMLKSGHEARITDEVRNFLGRRRFLPAASLSGNRWPSAKLREEAIRQGGNMKIQSGAQDLLKRSEIRVMEEVKPQLNEAGVYFEPCLQMHDEIMAIVEEEHWEITNALMTQAMIADEEIAGVKLECEGKMASDWGGLK